MQIDVPRQTYEVNMCTHMFAIKYVDKYYYFFTCAQVLVVSMILLERKTCVKSSGVLFIFWMLLVLVEGIRLRSNTRQWFRTVGDLTMVLIVQLP